MITLLFAAMIANADVDFEAPCFRDIPKKCGDIIVPEQGSLTEEEKKVLTCRIRELSKCIREQTEKK